MKKKVNGKLIDIKNIEIFEKAAESLAVNRYICNNTLEFDAVDFTKVKAYVALYNAFYKTLPFPLYALDSNIKYAAVGTFIKKNCLVNTKMWVDGGLFICLDEHKRVGIGFINSTWGIIRLDRILDDNTDINLYTRDCGYDDMKWALEKILKRESTSQYYAEFMPEFVEACNNQPMVLKWELGNILEFGRVPNNMQFKQNVITDLSNGKEYTLDIYVGDVVEIESNSFSLSLVPGNDSDLNPIKKFMKYYKYDVYSKESTANNSNPKVESDKLTPCKLHGAMNLYNSLFKIKAGKDAEEFDVYTGFIVGKDLVYCIDRRLFLAPVDKFCDPKEIARGVELVSFEGGMIYFLKPMRVNSKIRKETIYSYSLKDGNLRLCKVRFSNI